jgi:hypothetical protein
MGKMRNGYKILVGKPEGKIRLEDLGVDGKIILEWILGKRWEDVNWMHVSEQEPGVGCCEHGNEPSGSIKGGEFRD